MLLSELYDSKNGVNPSSSTPTSTAVPRARIRNLYWHSSLWSGSTILVLLLMECQYNTGTPPYGVAVKYWHSPLWGRGEASTERSTSQRPQTVHDEQFMVAEQLSAHYITFVVSDGRRNFWRSNSWRIKKKKILLWRCDQGTFTPAVDS